MAVTRVLLALAMFALTACGGGEPAATPATPAASPQPEPASEDLKVAFVYVGPVGDGGWTAAHDQGRLAMEAAVPGVETLALESVPEGAEAVRSLSQLAEKGYKLIFTTSFGFMDPTTDVAARYPGTTFMHCSGYHRSTNVGTYFGKMEQAKYLTGLVAGKMSRSGKVGYIAPHPIPEVVRFVNAFTLGVRDAAPAATVQVVWTNSWFDPSKEREAAMALLDAGADVLGSGADSSAHLKAAEERGAFAIGYDSDARDIAPKAYLTSAMWDWSVVYIDQVKQVKAGTWTSSDINLGLESGLVKLAPLSPLVPPEVAALVASREAELKSGARAVFAGPLRKQSGEEAVAAGASLPDEALLSMDWFVEGVSGELPR